MHKILTSHGHRIRRLDIVVVPDVNILRELGNTQITDSSRLECLTITYEGMASSFCHDGEFFLLGQKVLPIAALAIIPISGRFPVTYFPNLTHLYLALTIAVPFSWSFLDFLHNTPKLEFLLFFLQSGSLVDTGFANDMSTATQVPVTLDRLRSLVIKHGYLSTIAVFLERLSIPETALVQIHGVNVACPGMPWLPRLSTVRSVERLSIMTEHTSMQMVAEGPSSGLWLQGRMFQYGGHDYDSGTPNWSAWLSELHTCLPLAQVTHLDLYIGMHHSIVPNLLQHMVRLEEFSIRLRNQDERLGGNPECSVARAVYHLLCREDALFCPSLRVFNIDVDAARADAMPDLYLDELKAMLLYRQRIGRPIHAVCIQPFAGQRVTGSKWDSDVILAGPLERLAGRIEDLKPEVDNVKTLRLGHLSFQYDSARWGLWDIDGAEKYWNREWAIQYVTPWRRTWM